MTTGTQNYHPTKRKVTTYGVLKNNLGSVSHISSFLTPFLINVGFFQKEKKTFR